MGVLSLIRSCRPQSASITAIRCTLLPGSHLRLTQAIATQLRQINTSVVRTSSDDSHRHFTITPTRYSWNKYKDNLHFYLMLGLIPGFTIVFLVNVFVGPAKLSPIPEDYHPKEWEYYKHPITRFMVRYLLTGHQEDYERNLFYIHEEEEKRKMRILTKRVEELMAYRGDYPNYYNRPIVSGKYLRRNVEELDKMIANRGSDFSDTDIPKE